MILIFGTMGIIGAGFLLSAIICYPLQRHENETLKQYLKEMF